MKEVDAKYLKSTFITEYNVKTKALKQLTNLKQSVRIIDCSTSFDQALIGCVALDREKNIMISCIIESEHLLDFHRSIAEGYSRFSFLRQKGTTMIVSIRDGKADLFAIYTKSDASKSITSHPQHKGKIAENVRWFEWDKRSEMLYVITQNVRGNGLPYDFSVYGFPDRRITLIYRTPIDLDLVINPVSFYARDYIKVLRFGDEADNAYCVCQQHYREDQGGIDVTVFILYHKIKLSYTIPLEYPDLNRFRIVFDRIDNLLMIYLPGHYIHLLDCSIDHPMLISLKFQGEQFANLIGNQKKEDPIVLAPFNYITDKKDNTNVLVTQCGRILYEYTLDPSCIDKILEIGDPFLDYQALLLSIIHFKDTELSIHVIKQLCSLRPYTTNSEVFKQFLIGTLHNDFVMSVKNDIPVRALSSYLPLYSSTFSLDYLMSIGAGVEGFSSNEIFTSNDKLRRRERLNFTNIDWRKVDKDRTTQPSSFRKFLYSTVGKFIGGVDFHTLDLNQDNECYDPMRNALISAYFEYIFDPLSREVKHSKNNLLLSSEFRNMQSHLSSVLYACIIEATSEVDISTQFEVLSNYHCAIEELMFPYPMDFPNHFAMVGYHSLPRNLFIQYMERRVFFITRTFVEKAILQLKKTPEDVQFANFLLSYLPANEAIDLIQQNHFDDEYIAESILAKEREKASKIDMDTLLNSEFLPLAMYVESLKGRDDIQEEEVKFIEDVSKNKFLSMLKSSKV